MTRQIGRDDSGGFDNACLQQRFTDHSQSPEVKMRFSNRLILAVSAGMIAVSSASAQTPPAPSTVSAPSAPAPISRPQFVADMDSDFRKIDADKNGIITKAEIEDYQRAISAIAIDNRRRALFASLDTDHNGLLSPAEFAHLKLPGFHIDPGPLLAQTDLNHDGQITLLEFRTGKLRNFDEMDTDKDSVVSVSEMRAAGIIR